MMTILGTTCRLLREFTLFLRTNNHEQPCDPSYTRSSTFKSGWPFQAS